MSLQPLSIYNTFESSTTLRYIYIVNSVVHFFVRMALNEGPSNLISVPSDTKPVSQLALLYIDWFLLTWATLKGKPSFPAATRNYCGPLHFSILVNSRGLSK